MKILVLYATKNGVTGQCAEILAGLLRKSHEVSVVSVSESVLPTPEEFDVVILGSSVRFGSINKRVKGYIKEHMAALGGKHTALFLCCGYSENFEEYVELQTPKGFKPTLGAHYFGGEMKPEKLRGFDKLVMKLVRGSIKQKNFENSELDQISLPEILPESISRLADAIRELL